MGEEEENCCCGCMFFSGWPVMWILLYGYVIFPHIATEKNQFLLCNPVTQPDSTENCEQTEIREQYCEQHYYNELSCCYYNGQTETYQTTNIECELSVNVWLYGVPAGIASAFFSYVLLTIIGAHPYVRIVRERIVAFKLRGNHQTSHLDQEVEMNGENNL